MRQALLEPPTLDELKCLNGWPENTVGYDDDQALIENLLNLCTKFGFGRVHQAMDGINDLWRHPEKITAYQQFQKERLKLLAQAPPGWEPITTEGKPWKG